VPSTFKGKFRVQLLVDLGPFKYTSEEEWHTVK
jgi:hypothetical protein